MRINLSSLPPIPAAANCYSHRVYLQIQSWLGNFNEPTDWGWHEPTKGRGLEPIRTTLEPAPENLLKIVTCGGRINDCGASCGCRKAGLLYSIACKYCSGQTCSNVAVIDEEVVVDENDLDFPSQVVHWPSSSIITNRDKAQDSDTESIGSIQSTSSRTSDESRSESPSQQPLKKDYLQDNNKTM